MESYFSMTFVDRAMYFQALRELYEAYVIHCFMRFEMKRFLCCSHSITLLYLIHYFAD